ncbi:MAG: 1-acyl-sn-glycerol-3-phosphate acyltransferase [Verrucomicrobiales bacterium]|jgi:1-acyl-sn-glycerol-3-phosphate acyltransferase
MSSLSPLNWEEAPDLPGSERFSRVSVGGLRRLVHRLWDIEIEGLEHIPDTGPALLCPNHLSFCDSVFVPLSLPRRIWAIGKGEYMDDWKTKHLFPAVGMIPVDRSGGEAAQAALDTAAKVLNGGHLFMIYPEGTRSRSGNLHKARTGAARLSLRCNAPIIPVGHSGTLVVQPPDQFKMKRGLPVSVNFGAPMYIEDHGDPNDPRTIRVFADAVMFEIAQLSGQKYVNTYAGSDDTPESPAKPIEVPPGRAIPTRPTLAATG